MSIELSALPAMAGHRRTGVPKARRFPVGSRLRVLPNHACATGAQYSGYHVLTVGGELENWPRFSGW